MDAQIQQGGAGDLDGLQPLRDFPRITGKMSVHDGVLLLTRRLGLTPQRARERARRYTPTKPAKVENQAAWKLAPKNYLEFDVLYTEVLHTGYDELRHLGFGRRYLINRILRAVLAGICDGFDPSGRAGDFPDRTAFEQGVADEIFRIQRKAIQVMNIDGYHLLLSLKVRMQSMATSVLQALNGRLPDIRRLVGAVARRDPGQGLRGFSDFLINFKKSFEYRINGELQKSRRHATAKRCRLGLCLFRTPPFYNGRKRVEREYARLRKKIPNRVLVKSQTDLRRRMDPNIPCWWRRPTDADWKEGRRKEPKAPGLERKEIFARYGMSGIPGLTEPLRIEDWGKARTDWLIAEVRENYRREREALVDPT